MTNIKYLNTEDYEERYILYMDILGFEEAINNEPTERFRQMKALLETIANINNRGIIEQIQNNVQLRISPSIFSFSDTIVATLPTELKKEGIAKGVTWHFLIELAKRLHNLALNHGFLSRGVLHQGQVYHNNTVVFGKGIIEAYRYESKRIKVPAIVQYPDSGKAGFSFVTFKGIPCVDYLFGLQDDEIKRLQESLVKGVKDNTGKPEVSYWYMAMEFFDQLKENRDRLSGET